MVPLPIGTTVTLFFTDIEGSTRLLEHLGEDYGPLLAEQLRLLRSAIQRHGGEEIDTQGDALFAVFSRPTEALVTAVEAQQAILTHSWPREAQVRVRIGLHTGEPFRGGTGYFGTDVHRAARICAAAHGGQVVLSTRTRNLIMDALPDTIQLRDLGQHRLKDLANPERLFQVVADGLPADFPPLRTLNVVPHNLPIQLTAFIGREHELEEIRAMVTASRLVTLTGPGGAGKTRLAIQVAADLADAFIDGVWLADLAPLSEGSLLPQVVASALRLREQPGQPMTETITDYLRPRALLLLLDNCEHMLRECAELAESLLLACPGLRILATSREALGIPGEVLSPLGPLSLPDPRRMPAVAEILQCDAVRLFAERAKAISPAFGITSQNASPVAEICLRLDGIPLALELAAARVKVLTVDEIASRLEDRFRLLVQGSRTALPRQRTLQATMDWSYDLLSDQERIVLCRLAVFAGGFTLDAGRECLRGHPRGPGSSGGQVAGHRRGTKRNDTIPSPRDGAGVCHRSVGGFG